MSRNRRKIGGILVALLLLGLLGIYQNCGNLVLNRPQPPLIPTPTPPYYLPPPPPPSPPPGVSPLPSVPPSPPPLASPVASPQSPCGTTGCISGTPQPPGSMGIPYRGLCGGGAGSLVTWNWVGMPSTNTGVFIGSPAILNVCPQSGVDFWHGGGVAFQDLGGKSGMSNVLYDYGYNQSNWYLASAKVFVSTETSRLALGQASRLSRESELFVLWSQISGGVYPQVISESVYAPIVYKINMTAQGPRAVVQHVLEKYVPSGGMEYTPPSPPNHQYYDAVAVGDKVVLVYKDQIFSRNGTTRVYSYSSSSGFSFLKESKVNRADGSSAPQVFPIAGIKDFLIAGAVNWTTPEYSSVATLNLYKVGADGSIGSPLQVFDSFSPGLLGLSAINNFEVSGITVSKDPSENRFAICFPGSKCEIYDLNATGITKVLTIPSTDVPSAGCQTRKLRIAGNLMVDYCPGSLNFRVFKNGVLVPTQPIPKLGTAMTATGTNLGYCWLDYPMSNPPYPPGTICSPDGIVESSYSIMSIALGANNTLSISLGGSGAVIQYKIY